MSENVIALIKARSRRYHTETMIDVDNADDLALLANTPARAESQLHSRDQVAGDIGFYESANKTECTYSKQKRII